MNETAPALPGEPTSIDALDRLDHHLLNDFQRDFPLVSRPFAKIGRRLGLDEETVLAKLARLKELRTISRIGAIVAPQRTGWSTLAAMAVPPARLQEVAEIVNGFNAVNHNYEREHRFNLWFVVTGPDKAAVAETLKRIEAATGLETLDLPLVEAYRLDLGFPLQWA